MPEPRSTFVSSVREARDRYGPTLRALVGESIQDTWVAWDEGENHWFTEEPVILRIGGRNLEIICSKFDQLSLTCDTVDLDTPPCWRTDWGGGGFRLRWRHNALPELARVVGQKVREIRLLECLLEMGAYSAWVLNGFEFRTDAGCVSIYNALDENGVTDQPSESQAAVRAHPL